MTGPSICVRHNIEVAHRLWTLPGNKCEGIHGHSMWVEMRLYGDLDTRGMCAGLDFGLLKKHYREYLDGVYDHHLLLDGKDPLLEALANAGAPRMYACPGPPTTENIALWIGQWARGQWGTWRGEVTVHETHVNSARWAW